MSDLEKVYAFANKFCKTRVMQLRWEGAGDCAHAAALLGKLKLKTYESSTDVVKFHAVLNLYESNDSEISDKAEMKIKAALEGATDQQTYEMWGNVDVRRDSQSLGQPKADIMFVRNIMLTSDGDDSQTTASTELKDLHVTTVRKRSGSIGPSGQLRIGMSGAPGLISASTKDRMTTPVKTLFIGAPEMFKAATESGLKPPSQNNWGYKDTDKSVDVMKNNGKSLGQKPTYYLTFMG